MSPLPSIKAAAVAQHSSCTTALSAGSAILSNHNVPLHLPFALDFLVFSHRAFICFNNLVSKCSVTDSSHNFCLHNVVYFSLFTNMPLDFCVGGACVTFVYFPVNSSLLGHTSWSC